MCLTEMLRSDVKITSRFIVVTLVTFNRQVLNVARERKSKFTFFTNVLHPDKENIFLHCTAKLINLQWYCKIYNTYINNMKYGAKLTKEGILRVCKN